MTVSHRKNKPAPKSDNAKAAEPGIRYHCDGCAADITLTVRVRCAEECEDFDLCGSCFCAGVETGNHKATHAYRVVEQHSYPIFTEDWGADEELLLIDGCQIHGLGNWADIADHNGNRSKEEVEQHYVQVYIEGRDGTREGDERAEREFTSALQRLREEGAVASAEPNSDLGLLTASERPHTQSKPLQKGSLEPSVGGQLPVISPNLNFVAPFDVDEFQRRKRRRIEGSLPGQTAERPEGSASLPPETVRNGGESSSQSKPLSAPVVPPKPLVSAPTSHSELAGYMPGRLEFETEYEQEAEVLIKDMEFGRVYGFQADAKPVSAISSSASAALADASKAMQSAKPVTSAPATSSRSAAPTTASTHSKGVGTDTDGDASMADGDGNEGDTDAAAATAAAVQASAAASQAAAAAADPDDKFPDWDEDSADLELKLAVLDMYNERLDRRQRKKDFVLERRLVEMKRLQTGERRRPKEEREILSRVKHFAQMQNSQDFEDFLNGLIHEDALRRAAAQLQTYRRNGITSLSDAAKFETEKAERARKAAALAEGGFAASSYALATGPSGSRGLSSASRGRNRELSGTPAEEDESPKKEAGIVKKTRTKTDEPKPPRKPPRPLDISEHPSLHLLTPAEQELCSTQRIQPNNFFVMKKEIITQYLRLKGDFGRRVARTLFSMDVNKVGKVYDLLVTEGYLRAASECGWNGGENGVGVPPGHPMTLNGYDPKRPPSTNGDAAVPLATNDVNAAAPSIHTNSSAPPHPSTPNGTTAGAAGPSTKLGPASSVSGAAARGHSRSPSVGSRPYAQNVQPGGVSNGAPSPNESPFRPTAAT